MNDKTEESGDCIRVIDVARGMTRQAFLRKSAGGAVTLTSLGALLAACDSGNGETQGAPVSGTRPTTPTGALAFALAGTPPSLDPTGSFGINDLPVTSNIFDALLRYDGELQPSLATSYAANADATEWTFELRKGVKFHDGTDFDAGAVKANIEYFALKTSYIAFLVGQPERIDISDPGKVVVSFKQPFPEFGRYIAAVKIISPKLLEGSGSAVRKRVNETPTGTGPYRFVRRAGNAVVTAAFDDYWGDGPYIEDVQFKVVPDDSARVSALQAGDLDLVMRVPPPTAQGLKGQSIALSEASSTLGVVQLSLPTQREPFNDVRVRQALLYAIDRQAIVDSVYRGKGIVTGSPLPPGAYGFVKPTTQYTYDPEKAKSLLKAAGHASPVSFSMAAFNNVVLGSSLGQAIAEMANKAGFAVKFELVDPGVGDKDLASGAKRKYDVFILENGFLAGSALHVNNVVFYSQYEGKNLLGQIAKMNSIADGPERKRVLADVQEIWARELPCLPMWATKPVDARNASIAGYESPIDGFQPELVRAYRPASS